MFNNYDHYAVRDLEFAELSPDHTHANDSYSKQPNGEWAREKSRFSRDATIMCAGAITYDLETEEIGRDGDSYYFSKMFKHVANALQSADLSIGSLSSVVSDTVPPISMMSRKQLRRHYSVARPEFISALKSAGFDCLALANPYNLDLGAKGIASTEHHLKENGIVPAGLGEQKHPIFDINGIKIAVMSLTMQVIRLREMITTEGADLLLSKYDPERVRKEIQELRDRGAQFVLSVLDCRSAQTPYALKDRQQFAEELAEAGADYVICNHPVVVSKYYVKETHDGRSVPIASSLGTFSEGAISKSTTVSPLLRLVITEKEDGTVDVNDTFIPLRRFNYFRGAASATVPTQVSYNPLLSVSDFKGTRKELQKLLGSSIDPNPKEKRTIFNAFLPQVSPKDVESILGVRFDQEDLKTLGESYQQLVPRVSVRNIDLVEGCCAVVREEVQGVKIAQSEKVSEKTAVSAGARFAIATRKLNGVPTLVVERPFDAYLKVMGAIRDKYDPLTIAVTGTAGKTTTKDMITDVMSRTQPTFCLYGNGNNVSRAGVGVQALRPNYRVYVQEAHEGTVNSASRISKMIKPSIAVITSVGEGHLEQMGSIEEIVRGNLDIVNGMSKDGVLIVNDDSELLRDIKPHVRVVRYSTQNEKCDFFARDIRTTAEGTSFTIVTSEGEFDCHLRMHGVHNVSNALATFAATRLAGAEAHHILAGLAQYEPTTERQNLMEYGGYTLLVDTYNSNILSLKAALDVISNVELKPGAKRIAVLGDMGEQGDKFEENHTLVGEMIGQMPIDVLMCQGEGMRFTAQAAMDAGIETHHFSDTQSLVRATAEMISQGDAILFKASGGAEFRKKVVYRLFGKIV